MTLTNNDFKLDCAAGEIGVRLTPWDERAFGFRTAEIQTLHVDAGQDAGALLEAAENWCHEQSVQYVFGRVDANDRHLRATLMDRDYRFVETSITVARSHMSNLPAVPSGMAVQLRATTVEDIPVLREVAMRDFKHGRFLEDPRIDQTPASARNANWIEDLVKDGLAYVAEARGRTIGFHAERVYFDRQHAELLLTGAAEPYAMFAMPLWVTALESLAERNIQSCSTLVSAANIGIINLYAHLGFQFTRTLTGFRKFL